MANGAVDDRIGSFVELFGAAKRTKRAVAVMFGSFLDVFGAVPGYFRARPF
ncbi:hypothetical protein [Sporosarcina sp.]|uniref:hypothetical protein n=1 Tax=Sporosarcina sp. TaxID=49982 RepID=UPI00261E79A3|nr:hypothetical protein [Sporosarcina sp.]